MVTELLQNLIRIPSVNPDVRPDPEHGGELRMVKYLESFLTPLGFEVTLEEVRPGRHNIIARCPGSQDRPRIFFGPHTDTVSVKGMTIEPFSGDIRDGCIWGRGASDTKGPMAAMLTALANRRDVLAELPVAVDFVGFMGEETTQLGSKDFGAKHGREYQLGIAGEPTSLDIVYVTKGSVWFTIEAKGKAAHSSQPERGENAIMTLARSLDIINRKLSNRLATYTHPVLGHSTLNIGTISGGASANIVPDHAEARLDIRYTPDLHAGIGPVALVEQFIEEMNLPVSLKDAHTNPPMEVAQENPLLQSILGANTDTKLVGAPWFSDAAHLNDAGCPSVCLGPGSIDQAHTKDEFIRVSDLEAGVTYFENLIDGLKARS